jgi:hypothetical protein
MLRVDCRTCAIPAQAKLGRVLELHKQTPSNVLLTFASYLIIPVHERTLGIFAPCPDVQLEEIRQVETVWRGDELEVLSIERRRIVVIVLQPRGCIHDVLDADQPASISHWLVDQRFGMRDINLAVAYQSAIHVVNSHGAMVGTTDAAKRRSIPGKSSIVYVNELLRRLSNLSNQLSGRLMTRVICILRKNWRDCNNAAHQRQSKSV